MSDHDPTEALRRERQAMLNSQAAARAALEAKYGKVWTRQEVEQEFEFIGFLAPIVTLRRRADGKLGSMEFQHDPRFYFNWQEDS